MWYFAVSWMALQLFLVQYANGQQLQVSSKSCLDHLRSGRKTNGYYSVVDQSQEMLTVYCDFESEPGSAWTLVMSWSFRNKDLPAFRSAPLTQNVLVNEKKPNWIAYRQSKKAMGFLKSQSSHWRATCSFNKVEFDYRDYVRGSFKDFDVTTFLGRGHCKIVEFIDIRGNVGYQTTVPFWQSKHLDVLHTDSSTHTCLYNAATDAVRDEDNFGHYRNTNPKFRCTSDPSATTQYWFGGYI